MKFILVFSAKFKFLFRRKCPKESEILTSFTCCFVMHENLTHINRAIPHVMHAHCWIVMRLSHMLTAGNDGVHPVNQTC